MISAILSRSGRAIVRIVWSGLRLLGLAYYLGTLSFRTCFHQPITFDSASNLQSQYQPSSVKLKFSNNVVAVLPRTSTSDDKTPSPAATSTIKESKYYRLVYIFHALWQLVSIFPLEVVGYATGLQNFGLLRLFRLLRLKFLNNYWDTFTHTLERYNISKNVGVHRFLYVVMIEIFCAHVVACIYYYIALCERDSGNSNNWLVHDKLATFTSTGSTVLLETISFRYIRSWYYAAGTLAGIGYGDISAWALSETWFVIFFLYLTTIIICTCIAISSMLVTNYDSAKIENRLKVVRFTKYASYRKLPTELTNRVLSYYEYQWQLLKGVDENSVSIFSSFNILILLVMSFLFVDLAYFVHVFDHLYCNCHDCF